MSELTALPAGSSYVVGTSDATGTRATDHGRVVSVRPQWLKLGRPVTTYIQFCTSPVGGKEHEGCYEQMPADEVELNATGPAVSMSCVARLGIKHMLIGTQLSVLMLLGRRRS